MAVPAQPSKSEFTISAFEMLPTTMPTKTHYLQSSPLKIQDAANLTMFSCQTGANENHICWKMPSGIQVLPKSRTKTEAWILLTPPDTAQVNMTSSVKMSPHITWDRWSWFSMLRKARAKQCYSWMNGTLFMIFISCLKGWRTCSWLRFCFSETGCLVYGPVESFILPPLLYFILMYPSSSPFNCLNLTHLPESQAPSIPISTHLTNTYTTEISTLTKRWWSEAIYWSSYRLSYWQQACSKSIVTAE